MTRLYNILIKAFGFGIKIHSNFNKKSKKWIDGRKQIFDQIELTPKKLEKPIWFHCASLGEFEQGRPIIELIKKKQPNTPILLTFFSPSGYEIQKSYKYADAVLYLPLDTKKNATDFIDLIQPSVAIFVKYEFWLNFLNQISIQNIPLFLISASFRPNQIFFKWYGNTFLKALKQFTHIFVQSQSNLNLLTSYGINAVSVAGDTRIDRVAQIAKEISPIPVVNDFCENFKVLVVGSSWPKDEVIIEEFIQSKLSDNWKIIIAPHDVSQSNINRITRSFSKHKSVVHYSKFKTNVSRSQIMIIDNIGMLNKIYQYGTIAYIGGGFGEGIHNILEPITFGLPVIFGPKYQKFNEANILVEQKGAFSIQDYQEFETVFSALSDKAFLEKSSSIARKYVDQNEGATNHIYDKIIKNYSK